MTILLVLSAFEFSMWASPGSIARFGAAPDNWRLAWARSAQSAVVPRFGVTVGFARPFGLDGLNSGSAVLAGRIGPTGLTGGVQSLHLAGYSETEFHAAVGASAGAVSAGTGVSLFVVSEPDAGDHVAPGFDAGVRWSGKRFTAGIDALRLNSPMLGRSELPMRLALSGCWRPVPEFAAALEVGREDGVEDIAAVCEFRPAAMAAIRAGVGVPPLRYAAGLGLALGAYGVDYCVELNPSLGVTHQVGITAQWQ